MIPFEPEGMRLMKARFAEAVRKVYELDAVEAGLEQRPGVERKHVFDFEDGMRLIVSRDRLEGEVSLHVSVSFMPGREVTGREFLVSVLSRVTDMSGGKGVEGLVQVFTSEAGVVHFLFPEKQDRLVVVPMPSPSPN